MTNSNYPWGSAAFAVTNPDRAKFFATISGRERWVLKCLAAAGETGCIPLKHPRPRWAAYVHDLCRNGSVIETVKERDGGSVRGADTQGASQTQRRQP